ncbi:hypothetical protein GGS23DRAFT_261936 [Durotheca rogersii]|uniref:uncharacterized protein n=1 Tax=Durotheca rogersii TaxID=419775 RepID=UPI00221E60B4|nr:uncharacterized protein GGS23DRAFT_261936 [Durotheca rogersii]KAI5859799.1 hypothetical protein GGS23DRAFT_261936 [Durotheca rogersii]
MGPYLTPKDVKGRCLSPQTKLDIDDGLHDLEHDIYPDITNFCERYDGYTPVIKAFIKDSNATLTLFSNVEILAYTIHDGFRINMTADTYVTYWCSWQNCGLLRATSELLTTWNRHGRTPTLPAPALNILASYIPPGGLFGYS